MVEDYQHYEYFMDEFGSLVVGRGGFDVRSRERVPEKWLSVAGEAFVLMSIENYMEWVTAEVLEDAPTEQKRIIGKWSNNSNAARYEGIEKEGIERYEKLFDEVIKARKQNGRMKHSKKYLEYRADLYKNRQSGMKKKAAADNGEEVSQKRTKCEDVVLDF